MKYLFKALDLKNGNGSIYPGPAKGRADCTLTIDENDSLGMFEGTLEPAKVILNLGDRDHYDH